MGMIVDTSVGPAIVIVVDFVLKYIQSVTVSCNFCAVRPESSSYLQQFTIHIFFQNSRFTKIIRHKILMKHCYFSLGCLPDKTAFKTVTRSISITIIMAVQTFNIDKSMVTCNLLTYCRSISVKKKTKTKTAGQYSFLSYLIL